MQTSFLDPTLPQQGVVLRMMSYVRIALLLALVGFMILNHFQFKLSVPTLPLVQIALCLLVLTLGSLIAFHQNNSSNTLTASVLLMDSFLLLEFLYFTGGASNPLTILLILPIVCAALFCPLLFAWGLSIAIMLAYLGLFFYPQPMELSGHMMHHGSLLPHLIGMWVSFSFSVFIMLLAVAYLIRIIKQHKLRLNHAYNRQQESETWLVLGMNAASVAHELSTPLNNLLLIKEELEEYPNLPPELKSDLELMEKQLQQCKQTLTQLKNNIQPRVQQIDLYQEFAIRLKRWLNLRPDAQCHWHQHPDDPIHIKVMLDESFWSAFFNILNNAADASDHEVDIYTHIVDQQWQITIHNKHGILSPDQLASAGLDIVESTKPFGLGLGMHLAHATFTRLNGRLTLNNHPSDGVEAQIQLPLMIKS